MEKVTLKELDQLKGGGCWLLTSNGKWIYIPDDEESDGDDVIEL